MSSTWNWLSRAAVLLPIALGACAQYAQYGMTTTAEPPAPLAWDGAGQDPNLAPPQRHAHNAAQPVAQTADGQSTSDPDAQLARKLVICSTCVKPTATTADRTDVAQVTNR